MSMSSEVIGFKPPDEKFQKMLAAYEACKEAGINPPEEVMDFFNDEAPDPAGVVIEMEALMYDGAFMKWSGEMQDGFEVNLELLPEDVKIIRFINSY